MSISKNRWKVILAVLTSCHFGSSSFAQEDSSDASRSVREFVMIIDGATNPELISDEALFLSLSGLLESAGPSNCSGAVQPKGFSATAPCLRIEGVDMAKAERLAKEFRDHNERMGRLERSEFCDQQEARNVRYLNRQELASELDSFEQNSAVERSTFFKERGNALLGREDMSRLTAWARENLRDGIREKRVDYASVMKRRKLSPEQFSQALCSAGR